MCAQECASEWSNGQVTILPDPERRRRWSDKERPWILSEPFRRVVRLLPSEPSVTNPLRPFDRKLPYLRTACHHCEETEKCITNGGYSEGLGITYMLSH